MLKNVLLTTGLVSLSLLFGETAFMSKAYATDSQEFHPTAETIAAELSILENIPEGQRGRQTKLTIAKLRKEAAALQGVSERPLTSDTPPLQVRSSPSSSTISLPDTSTTQTPLTHFTKHRAMVGKKNLPQTRQQKEDIVAQKLLLETSSDLEASKDALQRKIDLLESSLSSPEVTNKTASYIAGLKALLTPTISLSTEPEEKTEARSNSTQPSASPTKPMTFAGQGGLPWVGNIDASNARGGLRSSQRPTSERSEADKSIERLNTVTLMTGGALSMFSRQHVRENHAQYMRDLTCVEEANRSREVTGFGLKKDAIARLGPQDADSVLTSSSPRPVGQPRQTKVVPHSSSPVVLRGDGLPPLPTTTQPRGLSAPIDDSRSQLLLINGSDSERRLIIKPEKDIWDDIKDFFISLGNCFTGGGASDEDETRVHEKRPLLTQGRDVDPEWREDLHGRVKGSWNPVTPEHRHTKSRLYGEMPIPPKFSYFPGEPSTMSQSGFMQDDQGRPYSVTATVTVVPIPQGHQSSRICVDFNSD